MTSTADKLSTILLVEDHLPDALMVKRSLKRGGGDSLSVEHVSDLESGLQRLSSGGIDLVLLDLSLPDSAGVETLQRVCDHYPQVPIVVLTGLDDPNVGVEMVKSGAQDFVVKNDIDDRLVVRSIHYAIERKQIQESVIRLAHEQAILAEVGRIISSSIEFESVFQLFAQQLLLLVSFDRIVISLVDDEQEQLTNTYDSATTIQPDPQTLIGSANESVIRQGKTVLLQENELSDSSLFPGYEPDYLFFIRTFLSVPLTSDGKIIGVLQLFSNSSEYYTKDDLKLTEKVAVQISGAVANSKLLAERRRLEEQLLQSQKMEAVGKLAGGIAHDFNNLLTPILGFSEMMLDSDVIDDWSRQKLEDIHGSATRATDLVHQLLAFSRKEIIERQVLALDRIIMEIETMIRRLIGEDIELEIISQDDIWHVTMDPTQVQQVIINLVVNSRDAMPNGGRLTIRTHNVTEVREDSESLQQSTIRFVELAVTDSGSGISPEDKSRIFDPFFTTKEIGQGTGLGLSTCYGIISQSNGTIDVDSETGKGTTFKIKLPATSDTASSTPSRREDSSENRGNETLLLAEDEELVREVAAYILRQQGYNVLEARDGFHALELVKEHGAEAIHALITDVVMPKMSGRELARQFIELHPASKVIYTSGYTDEVAIKHEISIEKVQFIKKPFTPGMLARKVRAILDT